MSRIPPSLLYLAIYNPTIRPVGPVDDDDAEEQAQILFYTSKEKAVSRDRMLRQIGLAKALASFSDLFNAHHPCENVHSQTKRMVMVQVEPNFWIHAGIELAKIPKVEPKSKAKDKDKDKDKANTAPAGPTYDYEEASLYDIALRGHILQGYERFKLTHGSFSSILSKLGQTALELQLERFWTVWSWSWDLESEPLFGEDFGAQVHPHHAQLASLVDAFADNLSKDVTPLVLFSPFVVPSTFHSSSRIPPILLSHLLSMIPPPALHHSKSSDTLNTLASSVETIRARVGSDTDKDNESGKFLGMPAVNLDMRKWNWPGYLTFGRGGSSKEGTSKAASVAEPEKPQVAEPTATSDERVIEGHPHVEVEVNPEALQDALWADTLSLTSKDDRNGLDDLNHPPSDLHSGNILDVPLESPPPSPPPLPEFSLTKVHLSSPNDPTATNGAVVHYYIRDQLMLALVHHSKDDVERTAGEDADLEAAARNVLSLFDEIETTVEDANLKGVSDSLPSATKILQPQDRFVIATGQYAYSSPKFVSNSGHLFNAQSVLGIDPEIKEVFSRGQNPQHWHIAKKTESNGGTSNSQAVFLEVSRKETSLTDVDNILAGVVKKSGISNSA